MKLGRILTTALLLAVPVAAGAQGRGGMTMAHGGMVSMAHGGHGWGHSGGFHGRGFGHHGFHRHFDPEGVAWGWYYPYGGWSDCGDSCGWGDDGDFGAPPQGPGYAEQPPPPEASCGGWIWHDSRYVWAPDACSYPPPADPPQAAASASNECSDWVWRAALHHSICKRPERQGG
jgi:hypothetical protein